MTVVPEFGRLTHENCNFSGQPGLESEILSQNNQGGAQEGDRRGGGERDEEDDNKLRRKPHHMLSVTELKCIKYIYI